MGLSGRKSRYQRERERRLWGALLRLSLGALLRLSLGVALVLGFGAYGYRQGEEMASGQVLELRGTVDRLAAERRSAVAEAERLAAELTATRQAAEDYRRRYEQALPSREVRELVTLVRGKLDSGVAIGRLASFIDAAAEPRDCGETQSKRFIVRTPNYEGGNTQVRFSEVLTVSAEGVPAQAANGAAEQWFDAGKSVTVQFAGIDGRTSQVNGVLPLQHRLVLKGREYRFSIGGGPRGFVEVSGDSCLLPQPAAQKEERAATERRP